MKVIEQKYTILTKIDRNEILKRLEEIGRTAYKSEDLINEDSSKKFIKIIMDKKHESVIEHHLISIKLTTNRGCCYDKDTMVLTSNGFKYFKDVNNHDKIATIDESGKTIFIDYIKFIKFEYNGKMCNFKSTQIDLSVTPNHNMYVFDYNKRCEKNRAWKFIKAENMCNDRYMFKKNLCAIDSEIDDTITIPGCEIRSGISYHRKYDSLVFKRVPFMKLLGLWITDGYISKIQKGSGRCFGITQSKPHVRTIIEDLLKELNIKYSVNNLDYRISLIPMYMWLYDNFIENGDMKKSYYIRIPKFIKDMDINSLSSFIDGCMLGNGTVTKDGKRMMIYTASYGFALDFTECLLKIGKCANINKSIRHNIDMSRKIIGKVQTYIVNFINTFDTLFIKRKHYFESDYNDYVYCLELPEHHLLYVMRNGKGCWCGNSHEIVRHRIGASYVQESTRYCNYSKGKFNNELTFISPNLLNYTPEYKIWEDTMKMIEENYMKMIELGVKPEQARSILPNSLKADIVITMNLRAWRHFFELRCDKTAHPDIRRISLELLKDFNEELPEIFGDLYERFFGHLRNIDKVCYITNTHKISQSMIDYTTTQILKYNTLLEANIQSLKNELNKGLIDIDVISSIVGSRNDVTKIKPYYYIDINIFNGFITTLNSRPVDVEFNGLNKKEAEYIISILFGTDSREGLIINESLGVRK